MTFINDTDTEFEESAIKSVRKEASGWSIERADGWSFFVSADSPVEPVPGMIGRFYGKGIGFPVRGLSLDGVSIYYRSAADYEEYSANEMYGVTVDDLLAKWDRGDAIWSIERGGLGPGYEQAIQIMAVEFARAGKDMPRTDDDKADYARFDELCSATLKRFDEQIGGASGAQFGAAKWLAWQWCFNGGPRKLIERAKAQGIEPMQVSKNFPKAPDRVAQAELRG